jgi:light-dependent protochlorophyllide reductase
MSRSAVLVTGGNSGIGFECARELARNGWHVVIASRDRALSQAATRRIAAETGNAAVTELGVDLGSTQSVRDLVWEIDARDLALRALVCNAGLQSGGARKISADGYELTFAVNHLGHFLLANLLLQRLLANAPARIVVVSSGVHDPKRLTGMPKAAVTDMAALAAGGAADAARFNGQLAYVNSKLCNMWFAYELDRRLAAAQLSRDGRLTVNAFDPGLVPGSGLARDYTAALRFAWNRVLPGVARVLSSAVPGISTARKSGAALAQLVLDPALAGTSRQYFPSHTRWRQAPSSAASYDEERARSLWEASVRMSGLSARESPLMRS